MLDLEFSNNLTKHEEGEAEESRTLVISSCFEYFIRIFCFLLREYKKTDMKVTKYLFLIFRTGLEKIIKETPDTKKLNSFHVPFMRCFSYFLNKFLYLSIDENKEFPDFRKLLLGHFAMQKEEFDSFIYEVFRRLIRVCLLYTSDAADE
eukprot:TRINITY_DN17850_c0_g1_i1.p1 TRINITY_DN17850_c0_g1~~TRINITY_DN17850_c0_g1_i1.p1  ORF type:complete len:149 (+),score=38.86 TRINITY_DN17850_c0_g1_i1:127-573(+)